MKTQINYIIALAICTTIIFASCKKEKNNSPSTPVTPPAVNMVNITGYMLFAKNTNDTIANFTGVSVRFYNSNLSVDTTISPSNLTYITDTWMYGLPWPGVTSATTSQYNAITISVPENSSCTVQVLKGNTGVLMYQQYLSTRIGFDTASVNDRNPYLVHLGNMRDGTIDDFSLSMAF